MTGSALYEWPASARFGRVVPKTKVYEKGKVTATVREKFIAQVQRITWAYKLADTTINLRGDQTVPEIQVFVIEAKADDVSDDVLAAIDKAVKFPVFHEVHKRNDEVPKTRMVAAHKQLGVAVPRLSPYFSTDWIAAEAPRIPLPTALDLAGLYAALLVPMMPITRDLGESLAQTSARSEELRKVEREVAALKRKLRNEPQLNRKIEIRRQILSRVALLAELAGATKDNARFGS